MGQRPSRPSPPPPPPQPPPQPRPQPPPRKIVLKSSYLWKNSQYDAVHFHDLRSHLNMYHVFVSFQQSMEGNKLGVSVSAASVEHSLTNIFTAQVNL